MITEEMVQCACLAYGGGAFPSRMRDALEAVEDEIVRRYARRAGVSYPESKLSLIEPVDTPVNEVQVGDFIDTYLGYGEVTEIHRATYDSNLYSLWIRLHDKRTDRDDPFSTSAAYLGSKTVRNWSR